MNFTENIKSFSDNLTNLYMDNSVSIVLGLVLILYIAMASSKVPKVVTMLLDNNYLKIALILLIAYVASRDAPLAIILAIALLVTLQKMNKDKVENNTLAGLRGVEGFGPAQNIDYPADGLEVSKDVKLNSDKPVGMDSENLAPITVVPEKLLDVQSDLPKDIPKYVAESVPLYAPSKNEINDGNFCGNDSSFNNNGPIDSGLLLLDNVNVHTEQKNRLPTNIAGQDNCSGHADVSNFTTGYSGLELASV